MAEVYHIEGLLSLLIVVAVIAIWIYGDKKKEKRLRQAKEAERSQMEQVIKDFYANHSFQNDLVFTGKEKCYFYLAFDRQQREFVFIAPKISSPVLMRCDDILSSTIQEKDYGAVAKKRIGTGRVLLSALSGNGALTDIASVSPTEIKKLVGSIVVHVETRNPSVPVVDIICWNTECTISSNIYRTQHALAEEINGLMQSYVASNNLFSQEKPPIENSSDSIVNSLTSLGKLKEQGIITNEEFEIAKSRVLASKDNG